VSFTVTGNDAGQQYDLPQYRIAYTNTYGKPPWYDFVRDEYAACREQVGLSDYSSFTKIDLWVCMVVPVSDLFMGMYGGTCE
jgi:glycine cleavage system aminomethyltransferase T